LGDQDFDIIKRVPHSAEKGNYFYDDVMQKIFSISSIIRGQPFLSL